VKGRKRHIVTDTEGWLLGLLVHTANIQDNHGAVPLLKSVRRAFPTLRHIFADRVYRGARRVILQPGHRHRAFSFRGSKRPVACAFAESN
jgi:transposase